MVREPRFYATVGGLVLFCGVGGAVSAGVPLHFLVARFGWRPVMFVTAAVLLLIGAAIWLIIRDDPAEWGYRSFALPEPKTVFSPATLRRDLMTVFRYRNIWLLFLAGGDRIYNLAAYRSGFLLIIAFSILSALAIGFAAETHCRQARLPDPDGNKSM